MKKLLIIQLDEAYFLYETLQMLECQRDLIRDFELTLLVSENALKSVQDGSVVIPAGTTTDIRKTLETKYDISANLSLNEPSWKFHHQVKASQKIGMNEINGQLLVPDTWSSYLLTIKARAPFLTFHLQDIYKNILGIRKLNASERKKKRTYQELVFGFFSTDFFSAEEQELLISTIHDHYPGLQIKDLSEVDLVSDLTSVLYVGPATFEALKLCQAGARGIFLGRAFQGFNLLPKEEGHFFISTMYQQAKAVEIFKFIQNYLHEMPMNRDYPYAVYQVDEEHLFGSYLKALHKSDENYPIYQSHVVLWNFILNLFDTNLEVVRCTPSQLELLQGQVEILNKLIRLYDYAMSSIDSVHQQSKAIQADVQVIEGHLKNLREIDEISDKISQSNIYLRPVLDFYRIRRGQNSGANLFEQSQDSFLLYSEEHQALKALLELFAVTLHKNEASI